MTRRAPLRSDPRGRRIASLFVATLLAVALLAPLAAALAPGVATAGNVAQKAPLYDGETATPNMTEWVPGDGNATAGGMLELLARFPGIYIGTGEPDPSGSGFEGVLLTGLVVAGAGLLAVAGTGVGPIAGTMVGLLFAFALTTVGLIPIWIQPLLIFALVGVPAARAILRVFGR